MSEDQKVHSVENDLELMQCSRLRARPSETEPQTSTAPAERQLLTQKPSTDGYSADAPFPARRTVQGETKENILGSRKEEEED